MVNKKSAPGSPPDLGSLLARIDGFRFTGRGPHDMRTRKLSLGESTVGRVVSTGHEIALDEPERATFIVPLQGVIRTRAQGRSLDAGVSQGLYLREGSRRTEVSPAQTGVYEAAIVLAPAPRRTGATAPGYASAADPATRAFSAHLRWFLAEVDRPDSVMRRTRALKATEALLVDFFDALDGFDCSPVARDTSAGAAQVARAEAFMRAHSDDPLTVAAVAEAAGVGVRALQLAFATRCGCSPRALLTVIRLERARERLQAPDETMSVSDVALLSGFAHLGRFASAYRARFGEAPSETLRRARRA
jgi:AraC-like DNA-binding protein